MPDDNVALAGELFDDYHDDVGNALSADEIGVLMSRPYSRSASRRWRPRRRLLGRRDPSFRVAGAVIAWRNYLIVQPI